MALPSSEARILDLAHLCRQTLGDAALEREVLALFEQQCRRLRPLIATGEDRGARMDAAHTLKGAARAVGAWRVAELAERVETALDEERPAETLALLNEKLAHAVADACAAAAECRRSAAA
jgi:HPt (histidine-containing phosphotransfer) domain-containing protein